MSKGCAFILHHVLARGRSRRRDVKQAAVAMRHTSKMQASATYDTGSSDRAVAAVMKVAGDYSAKFRSSDRICPIDVGIVTFGKTTPRSAKSSSTIPNWPESGSKSAP